MLDLNELEQLVAFADLGTLSRVSEQLHISTPSVTRAMQHLEETFGVALFQRGRNRIELNETGQEAVVYARKLLDEEAYVLREVRAFDQRKRTIVIKSCAPAPLWELQRNLNTGRPGMMVSSAICQNEEVLSSWKEGSCDIAILPFAIEGAKVFMQENLFVCVPKDHELAGHPALTFAQINGFNFLLRTELGFWDTLCREKMPSSRFLVQPEAEVFYELIRASSLPCFTTDYMQAQNTFPERVNIPLSDEEAKVTFYMVKKQSKGAKKPI